MLIRERSLFLSNWRATSVISSAAAALSLALVALSGGGCVENSRSNIEGNQRVEGGPASLDARGSAVDSEVADHVHVEGEGAAGPGGSIRISSPSSVDLRSDPIDPATFDVAGTVASVSTLTGVGIEVRSEQRRSVEGPQVLDFLRVADGGVLVLTGDTTFVLTTNALIQGKVLSDHKSQQDGHDLTIIAGGKIVVTGTIDVSGAHAEELPEGRGPGSTSITEPPTVGGNGGQLALVSTGDTMITGGLLAQGGGNNSQDPANGEAGSGGTIEVTSGAALFFAGVANVRAGNSFTNSITPGPAGGSLSLESGGAILMRQISRIDASGGRNTGTSGGAGGTVTIDATTVATVGGGSGDGLEIDVSGGRVDFQGGTAGAAGDVSLASGGTLTVLPGTAIRANGGDVLNGGDQVEPIAGVGGAGGAVDLEGSSIDVQTGVDIEAIGGDSLGSGNAGGAGGALRLRSGSINFDGRADLHGGRDLGGQLGPRGTLCTGGTITDADLANISGFNLPVAACP